MRHMPGPAVADSRRTGHSGAKQRGLFRSGSVLLSVGLVAYGLFVTDVVGGPKTAGKPAPDITVRTADGEFRLSGQRGKVIVLYFSTPGCPICGLEAPALAKVRSESGDQGVEVVVINLLPALYTLENWKHHWQSVGGGDEVLFAQDTHQRAFDAFKGRGLGTTIIINREGQVIYRDTGATPYDILRSEVDKAL